MKTSNIYKITTMKGARVMLTFDVENNQEYCLVQHSMFFNWSNFKCFRYSLFAKLVTGRRVYILRSNKCEPNKFIEIDNYMDTLRDISYFFNAYFFNGTCELELPNKQWMKLYDFDDDIYEKIVLTIKDIFNTNKKSKGVL